MIARLIARFAPPPPPPVTVTVRPLFAPGWTQSAANLAQYEAAYNAVRRIAGREGER